MEATVTRKACLIRKKARKAVRRLIFLEHYLELTILREKQINEVALDHYHLQQFHDQIINKVVQIAVLKVESEWGPLPTRFAFFVMGSAARMEQSVWSDQDHGIIFEGPQFQHHFLALGKEISRGLAIVGYEMCDGNVMASNPLWCKSVIDWEQQIRQWLKDQDWKSLRHFSTFFDSRVIVGKDDLLFSLKKVVFQLLEENPFLYIRLLENVGFIKKGMGFFGQLLSEEKGEETGTINVKQTVFFPYVNSLRLLALLEKIQQPSTMERFKQLPAQYESIKIYELYFNKLLQYRLFFQKNATSYKNVHLIHVKSMTKREKAGIKEIMKKGRHLFKETKEIINHRCSL